MNISISIQGQENPITVAVGGVPSRLRVFSSAPAAGMTIPIPAGSATVNDAVRYFITPSAPINLSLAGGIIVPSRSGITFPVALVANETVIVQITFTGADWKLTTLV